MTDGVEVNGEEQRIGVETAADGRVGAGVMVDEKSAEGLVFVLGPLVTVGEDVRHSGEDHWLALGVVSVEVGAANVVVAPTDTGVPKVSCSCIEDVVAIWLVLGEQLTIPDILLSQQDCNW